MIVTIAVGILVAVGKSRVPLYSYIFEFDPSIPLISPSDPLSPIV
jgi:hypothetical protein